MVSVMESISNAGIPLPPLFKQQMANITGNSTATGYGLPFASGMMDSILSTAGHVSPFSQLLLIVYRFLGAHLGIDPSVILTTLGFLWGISKVFSQIYNYISALIHTYLMCSMHVSEDDRIYDHLMKWMAQHPSIKNNKYLMAQTVWRSAWDDGDDEEEEDAKALFWTDGGDEDGTGHQYLNFSNQAARSVS